MSGLQGGMVAGANSQSRSQADTHARMHAPAGSGGTGCSWTQGAPGAPPALGGEGCCACVVCGCCSSRLRWYLQPTIGNVAPARVKTGSHGRVALYLLRSPFLMLSHSSWAYEFVHKIMQAKCATGTRCSCVVIHAGKKAGAILFV